MTRLIDADKVNATIDKFIGYFDEDMILRIKMKISAIPTVEQPKQKWIPCSERLPEVGQIVIVTDDRGKVYEYELNPLYVDKYATGKWRFLGHEILAWMPLPEPYEVERVK